MIKQDIIKAREQLAVKEAMERGYTFARTYKAIREALSVMVNFHQPELIKNNVSIRISEYTVCRLESLGITVFNYPAYVWFRLHSL